MAKKVSGVKHSGGASVLKKTGSFYYHCDWHASHYVKARLDQILVN